MGRLVGSCAACSTAFRVLLLLMGWASTPEDELYWPGDGCPSSLLAQSVWSHVEMRSEQGPDFLLPRDMDVLGANRRS